MQIPGAAAWDRVEGGNLTDIPWKQLCEAIVKEKDPQELLALVDELNRELERQANLLNGVRPSAQNGIGVR